MKLVAAAAFTFAGLIVLNGCVAAPPGASTGNRREIARSAVATDREAAAAWNRISADIRALERRRAPRRDWQKAAQFEEAVVTRADLNHVLRGMQLDGGLTEVEAVALFQSSAFAAHYGFPANLHALVFFDRAGRFSKSFSD